MDWKKILTCVSGCFKAKTVFATSCYFNLTSLCEIGKVYLFCKKRGGLAH